MKTIQLPDGIQSDEDLQTALKAEFGAIKSQTTLGPNVPGEWRQRTTTHTVFVKSEDGLRLATVKASWDERSAEIYDIHAREILWEDRRELDDADVQAALDLLEPRIEAALASYSSVSAS